MYKGNRYDYICTFYTFPENQMTAILESNMAASRGVSINNHCKSCANPAKIAP
jgi:hypothetical protein